MPTPAVSLPVLPPDRPWRLTPTDVLQFVRLEQCKRFLRFRLAERAALDFMTDFRLHAAMAAYLRQEVYLHDLIDYHSRRTDVLPAVPGEDEAAWRPCSGRSTRWSWWSTARPAARSATRTSRR